LRRVLLAAWGLGLAVAFLFFRGLPEEPARWLPFAADPSLVRGVDLARLPAWVGAFLDDLARHPVVGTAGLGRSAAGIALAALMVLAWAGAGRLLLGRERPATNGATGGGAGMDLAERCAMGAGAWSLLWFFLGAAGLYRTWIAVVALALGAVLGLRALPLRRLASGPPASVPRGMAAAALALVALTLGLGLVAALTPPTAKDTLLYHLAVPRAYVAAGRGVEVFHNLASYYPLGHEMQSVWALLLGGAGDPRRIGEAAAGAVAFAWAPILLAVVHGWVRERGLDRGWALVAALLVAAIPTVYHVATSVYVDLAIAAYIALAVRAGGRWWTTQERGWLRRLALALGWALCIKLTAVFLVAPLAVVVLARAWRARAGRAVPVAAAGLAALLAGGVLASPWYVRTWLRTGSPVYPFYVDLWGGSAPGWDRERSYQYEALFSLYGGADKSAADYLLAPLRLAVAAQPELPSHYDGVLGVALLFGLPLVAVALRRRLLDPETRIAAAASAAFFVAWLLGSQQLRYLLPAAPGWALAVVAAAGGCAATARARRALAGALVGLAALGVLVIVAWFAEQAPLRVVLGGEGREAFLARRLDYFPYYQMISRELPPDARVWLINMRRDTYHLERPYFSDYIFEDWTLRQWVRAARDADDVRRRAREAGLTHVLVRHDRLLDYDRSPIVDDRRPRDENLARLALAASFFRDGARLLRGDPTFWLIELGPAAP
jgi:hypothetical protein